MLGARASWNTGTPARLRYTPSSNRQCGRDFEIGRRAEALDERDRAGVGFATFQPRLLDQKSGNDADGGILSTRLPLSSNRKRTARGLDITNCGLKL